MNTEQKLRAYVRKMIHEELQQIQEMTSTGNIAGYETPLAFAGNKKKNVRRKAKIAQQLGWKLTRRGAKDISRSADTLLENNTDE